MRSWLLPVIGASLLVCAAPAAGQTGKKTDLAPPSLIGGKTVAQWIAEIPSKDRSKIENVVRTVLLFGPDKAVQALPVLLAELKKQAAGQFSDSNVREVQAWALGEILERVEKPDPRLVEEAVAALRPLLKDPQSAVKFRAAEGLARLGPHAKAAVPDLLVLAADRDTWVVRRAAVIALSRVSGQGKDPPREDVFKTLRAALRDDASAVRYAAGEALIWMAPPEGSKQETVTALESATKDAEPPVAITALLALVRGKAKGWETRLGALGKYLESDDPTYRMQAAEAISILGPVAQSQVPRLIGLLKDKDQRVVGVGVMALGHLQRAAAEAVPHLQAIQADRTQPENLRKMAGEALDNIRGKAK
jgi:uncharacterized protein (UPF0147 family)